MVCKFLNRKWSIGIAVVAALTLVGCGRECRVRA